MDRDDFCVLIGLGIFIFVLFGLFYARDCYEYELAKKHFPGMTKSEYIFLRPKVIAVQEKD